MPASFDRCVKHVKGKGKVDNPYAVCRASMGTDAEIKAREKMPHAPGNPVKKGTTHHAAKNLGIPKGAKNKGTTKIPYSSKHVASSIMKQMHRPRGG